MPAKPLKVDAIVSAIHDMNVDDLRRVGAAVRDAYSALSRIASAKLSTGDRVRFKGRWGSTVEGTIAKINPKTIHVVNCTDGQRWRVAPSLLVRI